MRMRNRPRCMWLIGWSLGKKGCEVKARIWEISGRLTNTRSSGKLQALRWRPVYSPLASHSARAISGMNKRIKRTGYSEKRL